MIQLVYIGACQSGRSGLAHGYVPLGPAGELTGRAMTFADRLADFPPGSQIRFETEGEAIVPTSAVFERTWPDADLVTLWTAAHEAAVSSARAYESDPPLRLEEILRPLREAYHGLGAVERAHLIAQVVRLIVGT